MLPSCDGVSRRQCISNSSLKAIIEIHISSFFWYWFRKLGVPSMFRVHHSPGKNLVFIHKWLFTGIIYNWKIYKCYQVYPFMCQHLPLFGNKHCKFQFSVLQDDNFILMKYLLENGGIRLNNREFWYTRWCSKNVFVKKGSKLYSLKIYLARTLLLDQLINVYLKWNNTRISNHEFRKSHFTSANFCESTIFQFYYKDSFSQVVKCRL